MRERSTATASTLSDYSLNSHHLLRFKTLTIEWWEKSLPFIPEVVIWLAGGEDRSASAHGIVYYLVVID